MKRLALALTATVALAAAGLVAGCTEDGNGQKINNPFEKKSASTPAKTPDQANYFEMKQDGRTYVFSKLSTMNAFRDGKTSGHTKSEELDGKTVVFEDLNYTDYNRLVNEYKKAHNIQ
jgi:hypothetical protein